jgi:peptidoglycan/LPS O-acetylase OafA/YrhL
MWLLYNCPAVRLLEFLIGLGLALEVKDGWRLPRWALPLSLAFATAAYVADGVWPTTFGLQAVTLLPFAFVIVAACSHDMSPGRTSVFGQWWAVRLGEWSFCFYLVHQVVVYGVLYHVSPIRSVWTWSAVALALLCGAVLASWALHAVVERPAERRLRGHRRMR